VYNDEEISKWIEKYGEATGFNFIIYGALKDEDIELLTKGLMFSILQSKPSHALPLMVTSDEIDEETAVAMNSFQGTTLSFVFGGHALAIEEIVQHMVVDGLTFLRYKNEYLGHHLCGSHV